ncbi:MAG: RDD family protein [Planctomycetota bacterium JB042]
MAETSLLVWGLSSGPEPIARVQEVSGAGRTVVALTPSGEATETLALVRLVPADEEGPAVAISVVGTEPGVLARLQGTLHLFTRSGVRTLVERVPTPAAPAEVDVAGEAAFEFDRFTARDGGGEPLAVAAADGVAWFVERGAGGRPRLVRYDRIEFSTEAWPADGPAGADAAVVAMLGDGAVLVAVKDGGTVTLLRAGEDGLAVTGSVSIGEGGDGLELLAGPDGRFALWTTLDGEGGRRPGAITVDAAGVPSLRGAATESVGDADARLVGAFLVPGDGGAEPRLLVADGREVEAYRADGSRDPAPIPFLGAWSALHLRFMMPLFAMIALFTLVGSFARRPRPRRRDERRREPTEAPLVAAPAPFGRRLLAGAFDFGVAGVATGVLSVLALDASTRAYLAEAVTFAGPSFSILDPSATLLLGDLQVLGLMIWFAIQATSEAAAGRTLGKAVFGLRVVSLEGAAPGLPASLTRSVLLFLDVFLTRGLLGTMLVVFTRRRQRLGDLLAQTMVIDGRAPLVVVRPVGQA